MLGWTAKESSYSKLILGIDVIVIVVLVEEIALELDYLDLLTFYGCEKIVTNTFWNRNFFRNPDMFVNYLFIYWMIDIWVTAGSTQGLSLALHSGIFPDGLWGHYGMPGIKPGSFAWKQAISLAPNFHS